MQINGLQISYGRRTYMYSGVNSFRSPPIRALYGGRSSSLIAEMGFSRYVCRFVCVSIWVWQFNLSISVLFVTLCVHAPLWLIEATRPNSGRKANEMKETPDIATTRLTCCAKSNMFGVGEIWKSPHNGWNARGIVAGNAKHSSEQIGMGDATKMVTKSFSFRIIFTRSTKQIGKSAFAGQEKD